MPQARPKILYPNKILYADLSYSLVGLCYNVHNDIGRFAREKQYADALEKYLKQYGFKYQREYEVPYQTEFGDIRGNRVDFLIEGKIILELKCKRLITKKDYYQIKRYLEASGLTLAILVNFREPILKPHRILNPNIVCESKKFKTQFVDSEK
jgi:GxxExxY protein